MAKVERLREVLSGLPGPEYWKEKTEAGWRLVAVVWEHEAGGEEPRSVLKEDVPFGLKVADDCLHLEEDTTEKQVLMLMLELIGEDRPLSLVAEELNRKGFRTRHGSKWSPGEVFDMLPRLIEVGPRFLSSQEWVARRPRLFRGGLR